MSAHTLPNPQTTMLDRAAKARTYQQRNAARRRASDPVQLARSMRTVVVAIEDGVITPAEVVASWSLPTPEEARLLRDVMPPVESAGELAA